MMIVRDVRLCWILGGLFELLQILFDPWLPNFKECWWDHIILDMLLCNGVGIFIGYLHLKVAGLETYSWTSRTDQQFNERQKLSLFEAVKKHFRQLLYPSNWMITKWRMFSNFTWYIGSLYFCGFMMLVDLNNFFGKILIWIPHNHIMLVLRVSLWGLQAILAAKELHQFLKQKSFTKIGEQIFICTLSAFIELRIITQVYSGQFTLELNSHYMLLTKTILIILAIYGSLLLISKPRKI